MWGSRDGYGYYGMQLILSETAYIYNHNLLVRLKPNCKRTALTYEALLKSRNAVE
jgi:hypothetical protein